MEIKPGYPLKTSVDTAAESAGVSPLKGKLNASTGTSWAVLGAKKGFPGGVGSPKEVGRANLSAY